MTRNNQLQLFTSFKATNLSKFITIAKYALLFKLIDYILSKIRG